MLTIRAAQMAVFEERAFAAFAAEAIDHLRTELPELTEDLADEALLDRLRQCIPVARQYGLSDAVEILAMVDATFLLDDVRFDLDPDHGWARDILTSRYLSSQEKALQLLDCAFAEHQLAGDD
jgi:hypothetical protein